MPERPSAGTDRWRVTYDTGALIAADRHDRRMWALHAGYLAEEVSPTVPAPVLAEASRGGPRQTGLARLIRLCVIEPMTEAHARDVGVLAGRAAHSDIVDVAVVEGATRRGDSIVTSDPEDIEIIATASGSQIVIVVA